MHHCISSPLIVTFIRHHYLVTAIGFQCLIMPSKTWRACEAGASPATRFLRHDARRTGGPIAGFRSVFKTSRAKPETLHSAVRRPRAIAGDALPSDTETARDDGSHNGQFEHGDLLASCARRVMRQSAQSRRPYRGGFDLHQMKLNERYPPGLNNSHGITRNDTDQNRTRLTSP